MASLSRQHAIVASVVVLAGVAAAGYWVWSGSALPGPGSPVYEQYVDAFQIGVAALDADVPDVAEQNLNRAVELIPEEPAGWANRGLLHLRTDRLPEASSDLQQANNLAHDYPDIQKLLGLLEQRRGEFGAAAAYLRRALESDPNDVKVLFLLGQIVDQEHLEGSDAEHQRYMERILAIRPYNLHVLTDRLRVAVRREDEAAVRDTFQRLKELAPGWAERTRTALADAEQRLAGKLGPGAVSSVLGLSNLLKAEPGYPRDAAEVDPPTLAGDSLQTFIRLTPVRHAPAAPDAALTFKSEPAPDAPDGDWDMVAPIWLDGEGEPAIFVASQQELRRAGQATGYPAASVSADGLVALDWNNDLRIDVFLSGGGLRFYQQQDDGHFQDATAATNLMDDVLQGAYHGAMAADVDLDGDVDLLLARREDSPLFLRNNFDGTFAAQPIFAEVTGPQRFAWADFDQDGAPDAALLDAEGKLRVFSNERSASFREWPAAPPGDRFLAMAVADANDDGALDLVVVRADGALLRISNREGLSGWDAAEMARWSALSGDKETAGLRLLVADLDNNGAMDLLASGPARSAIWLGAGAGEFQPFKAELPPRLFAAADLRGNGRLDLLGLDDQGRPVVLRNAGTSDYHWQTVRPRATKDKAEGDNRINSFGIGGEIELRSGTHVVKQPIAAPAIHFGLGKRPRTDVVRIVWPNGAVQVEFDAPVDKAIVAVQRLKGSCPFLFTWNGERFVFATDFMWSTPLGMYINAGDKGGFLQTTDWVKISGDQLALRNGEYELRVNANLWETHFFDHLALIAVDHPADVEMLVDERFYMEVNEPAFHLLDPPRPVAGAWDHLGRDAADDVRAIDDVFLDRSGRGEYQGVTHDHWVEIELGVAAEGDGPLWLVARGWVHPTDSSVNYALEQGKHDTPRGLSLETPDGHGGWKTARDRLGFPAGKNKTILIRLDELDFPTSHRRVRLRTNMEIYWDWLATARGRDDAPVERRMLTPRMAELRHRGIVAMSQANASSPELPQYEPLVAQGQSWRDLIGYHTRHGDVLELLGNIDDRYAIVTSGDEIVLRFEAPAEPPDGWKRDFVWVADGWVKDGDFNTRFGKTVLPLPAHDLERYDAPPRELEDDPVYRRHPQDWQTYHTRYVTPYFYQRGLRNFKSPQPSAARKE